MPYLALREKWNSCGALTRIRYTEGKGIEMRRVILLLSAMALALPLVSGVALAQPQGAPRQVLDVYCDVNETTLGSETFSRSTAVSAQSFKAKHTGRLTSAKVRVANVGDEPTAIVMEIRTVDSPGTPTATVEARTTIPASDVPDSMGVATGNFRPGAPVEAGKQYAIVLHPLDGGEISWGGSNTNICPGVPSSTNETHPGAFEPSPDLEKFFATFVTPGTTRATTRAGSANDGPVHDTSTKVGRLPKTGGLPVPVLAAAMLVLVGNGAAMGGLLLVLR